MGLEIFFKHLRQQPTRKNYIVRLAYKYNYERNFHFDNFFLMWDPRLDDWVWLDDWNEGQEYVFVVACVALEHVFVDYLDTDMRGNTDETGTDK